MRELQIQAVCGFGVGSSMLLKMKLSSAFKKINVEANVFTSDVASATSTNSDAIFTSSELAETMQTRAKCPVIVINSFVNVAEIDEKVKSFVESLEK